MELFKPSKKILEMICDNGEYLFNYKIYLRTDMEKNIRKVYNSFFPCLDSKLFNFYKFNSEKHFEFFQKHFVLTEELFMNCTDHGRGDIKIGIFLGNEGVCYGFCDEGSYFKNKDIKYQYENKIPIPLTNWRPKTKHNRRRGVENIFSISDLIEVDCDMGVLYCVLLNKSVFQK